MSVEELISRAANLDNIVARNSSVLGDEAEHLRREHGLDNANKLKEAFEAIEDEERLLQVGIVGRVKAGKSSLLNALFFDGLSVLPKAATPMTAALTTMTYGKKLAAEVEFYNSEDIASIRSLAEEYKKRFEEEKVKAQDEAVARLRQRYDKDAWKAGEMSGEIPSEKLEEVRELAERQARRVLQDNEVLTAADDQYCRIQDAGVDPAMLKDSEWLEAEDLHALKATLGDYVGSNGRFMPLTKSVHLHLPLESLRNIRVIDTPGLNDPVPSRERRTNELLMYCDVVFIVSPANQFLNSTDIELMGRITDKEGVHELYLVASQVDNALYGSDIKRPNLEEALERVSESLARHTASTLRRLRQDSPEVGETFDALINHPDQRVVNVSGMSHSLRLKFDGADDWDTAEQKAWENLAAHYPGQFSMQKPEIALESLEYLASTQSLADFLEDARQKKDKIVARRRYDLLAAKSRALAEYREGLLEFARESQVRLKATDLNQLSKQEKELADTKSLLTERMRDSFEGVRLELLGQLSAELPEALETQYSKAEEVQRSAGGTEDYSYSTKKDGVGSWLARKLWGGGIETRSQKRTVVNTPPIYRSINKFTTSVSRSLKQKASEVRSEWQKALYQTLFGAYRKTMGDEQVDEALAIRSLNKVVYGIPLSEFNLDTEIPTVLSPQGRLKGPDADNYLEEAEKFLSQLGAGLDASINTYIDDVDTSLPKDIAADFYNEIDRRIEKLRHDIENKAEALDRLDRLVYEIQHEAVG
ncbi:dynamin family protein [Halomonas sp. 18H]|nr:dynamin family protein [Halomonas sp. 18H]MCW4153678.1 dynamin family protein [Halomonas sp. 18H]